MRDGYAPGKIVYIRNQPAIMNANSIRRYLQAPDKVTKSFAIATFLAVMWMVLLLLIAVSNEPGGLYAIAPIFISGAVLATFATLRSAGVEIRKTLPSVRTAAFGMLALFAFCIGGLSLCLPYMDYALRMSGIHGRAASSALPIILEVARQPAQAAIYHARNIDTAVNEWARSEHERETSFVIALVRSVPFVARTREDDRKAVRSYAETRLKHFSGEAPAWQVTAQLCKEYTSPNGQTFKHDYRPQFEKTAANYTRLLGRDVKAADFLPRIPDGSCG